ncbi:hypothetical protein D3C79_1008560 [compost metagenome]
MNTYSPPWKLKRSEVNAALPVIDMSFMLLSSRGLFWRNWPPYSVRPSNSFEVT